MFVGAGKIIFVFFMGGVSQHPRRKSTELTNGKCCYKLISILKTKKHRTNIYAFRPLVVDVKQGYVQAEKVILYYIGHLYGI